MTIKPQEILRDDLEVKTALISVFDKTEVVDFAKELAKHGVKLISTGGTAKAIRDAGLEVMDVSDVTGSPEILDGRVKTLHPRIHGGILANQANPEHLATLAENGIPKIDMVVCNLYPFTKIAEKPDATDSELVENMDVGGVTLLRASTKNHGSVVVVPSSYYYRQLSNELDETGGKISYATRLALAKAASDLLSIDAAAVQRSFMKLRAPEKSKSV